MHVLITGGAGFIGSHIVERHLNQGDQVVIVDNLSTGSQENLAHCIGHPNLHFEKNDLLTWGDLPKQVAWAERIYHMAAIVGMFYLLEHPVDTLSSNILGCERLLRTMCEVKSSAHLILASTSEVYAASVQEYSKEDESLTFKAKSEGKWGYALSKFTEEMLTLAYVRTKAIKATIIRFFNTIGPRQNARYGMVVPRFMEQSMQNRPITVYGDGEQMRSFCDVRDTVAALDLIAGNQSALGEIINIGQNQHISINQLAMLIKKLTKSKSDIVHMSYQDAYEASYEDVLHRRPDLTKFYHYSNYQFQWTIERTLANVIEFMR